MTHLDFTWERREELIREEERKDIIKRMLDKGYTKEQIMELGFLEEEVTKVCKNGQT